MLRLVYDRVLVIHERKGIFDVYVDTCWAVSMYTEGQEVV
jgi:hypothetical protein